MYISTGIHSSVPALESAINCLLGSGGFQVMKSGLFRRCFSRGRLLLVQEGVAEILQYYNSTHLLTLL